jgi:crotonobetainyl-CoA:carnitine CoA-transferase CaiB-like acyl-CoA transferase
VLDSARGSGSLLERLRVVVLDDDVASLAAAWWLAELGADVRAPWLSSEGDVGPLEAGASSTLTTFFGRRLRAAETPGFVYALTTLDDHDASTLEWLAPDATLVRVTGPTGIGDAVAGWRDVLAWAGSGMAYLTRTAFPERAERLPRFPVDPQPSVLAGTVAALAVCAAEFGARAGRRRPLNIEVDRQEVLTALLQQPVAGVQISVDVAPAVEPRRFPGGVKRAADGLVFVQPVEPAHWERLLGRVDGLDGLGMSSPLQLRELVANRDAVDAALGSWVASRPAAAVVSELQDDHIPGAPVCEPADVLTDEHLNAREFFGPDGPTVPWIRTARETLSATAPPARAHWRPESGLPLEGLRVLDLSWAWAGPFATTLLADLGAEVINLEWHPRPSNLRVQPPSAIAGSPDASGWWSANQRGKASVGVNLKTPGGLAVVADLAAVSDVVVENFAAGVVDRLGVGFADLVARNPDLVYVSMSAFGASGPAAHWIGYGTQVLAASGLTRTTMPDDGSVALMGIPYPDPVSGLAAALAVVAAVGRGAAHLDLSELEATCPLIFGSLLAAAAGTSPLGPPMRVVVTADGTFVAATSPDGIILDAVAAGAPQMTVEEVMSEARASGGDAVVVSAPKHLLTDERLRSRGFWRADDAPILRAQGVEIAGPVAVIDGQRPEWWRGAPDLFEDTAAVLTAVLGYDRDVIDRLLAEGAIAERRLASADTEQRV